jgi:hypothetical protein
MDKKKVFDVFNLKKKINHIHEQEQDNTSTVELPVLVKKVQTDGIIQSPKDLGDIHTGPYQLILQVSNN